MPEPRPTVSRAESGQEFAQILEISAYPPPRAGWAVRVQYLKRHLDASGHRCVVLNVGPNRRIPSPDYETVQNALDYVRKVTRFTRAGFVPHLHANAKSVKGLILALTAGVISLLVGTRPVLTFHAGVDQAFFPRRKAPLWSPVMRLLFSIPSVIICNSDAVKAKILEYDIPDAKVVPIPAFSTQYLEAIQVDLPHDLDTFYRRFSHVIFSYLQIRPEFNPVEVIQAFSRVCARRRDVGLVLCGVSAHAERHLWEHTRAEIDKQGIGAQIALIGDLDHDSFLEALRRASVYLRSPATDGVASSVLEALSLRVPVVAADNGSRPAGVVCYQADDIEGLAAVLVDVLDRRTEIAANIPPPRVADTLSVETALLTRAGVNHMRGTQFVIDIR